MVRQKILSQLVDIIVSFNPFHPLRVAIDGIDNAGKTTLANELAPLIEQRGRAVIRASIDGFHRPRQERYSRGPDSAEGYYEDLFDYTTLREEILVPLGPDGNLHYRSATFDVRRDISLSTPERVASPNAILLFDGVFLLRPELVEQWDYRLFVEVTMEEALRRAMKRDLPLLVHLKVFRLVIYNVISPDNNSISRQFIPDNGQMLLWRTIIQHIRN